MNIDDLTIGQARDLAAKLACFTKSEHVSPGVIGDPCGPKLEPVPVVVCTDKRAVVFGYTQDFKANPIKLTNARMCLYWSADVGGVFGLADIGPTKTCKISAPADVTLTGVTAVFEPSDTAVKAWVSAKTQGR